jgi:hypothetical protein
VVKIVFVTLAKTQQIGIKIFVKYQYVMLPELVLNIFLKANAIHDLALQKQE